MRRISGVFCALLVVCISFSAEGAQFWVVGSFESLPGAAMEKRRVQRSSGLPVHIGTFSREGETLYRLLVRKDAAPGRQRRKLADTGISPWSLSLDPGTLNLAAGQTDSIWVQYLVLAGFSTKSRADEFVQTLTANGVNHLSLDEIETNGGRYFRVLYGPFDEQANDIRERAREMGIDDAWWVTKAADKPKPEFEPEPAVSQLTAEATSPEPEPAPTMPVRAPRAGESWFDYCIRRANSAERQRYCQNGEFMSVAVKGQQARQGVLRDEEYFLFCTREATADQRTSYCTDEQFAQKMKQLDRLR